MGLFDNLSRAASSVVTTVARTGSSAINTASRTASGAISGASSTINRTISSVGSGVSSIASGANPIGQAINTAARSSTSSISSILSNALKQVDNATKQVSTAVSQASEAATKATAGLSSINLGALPGGAVLGTTYSLVSGASDNIAAAEKAVNDAIKAGGSVSASVFNQIEQAKKQVASVQKQIKTTTDNTAKSILSAAESATGGKVNLAGLLTGLAIVNPVTAPLGIAAVASTVGNSIASALTGGSSTSKSSSLTDWFNLDYGNSDVQFTDLKTGESRGYLGQFAEPYAADENYVWFNTGRDNEQVPAGYSSWTDTPDAGKLTDYGLSGHVQSSSRILDAGEMSHVTDVYKNHGWLSESSRKIGTGLSSTSSGSSVLNRSSDAGLFDGISSALSSLLGGSPATGKTASSGNILDTVVETRDNMIVGGAVDVISGKDTAGGIVTAGSAMAVDVLLPLDLMNAVNKVATGRGDELTLEDWGYAALDGVFLGIGALTLGTGYVGGKALKTALKTGKNAAKVAEATKGISTISEATKAAEGVGTAMANYGKIGNYLKSYVKITDEAKAGLKQTDNIAASGKAVSELKELKTVGKGTDALKITKTADTLKTLKTGLIGGALGVAGLSVYSALKGDGSGTDTATGQVTADQIAGSGSGAVTAAGTVEDQGIIQQQIDEIVDFLNDAFGGSSTATTGGSSGASGSGAYGSGIAGEVAENAVGITSGIPVIGDIIKALADRGLLVPIFVGGILLAGVAYYFTRGKKTGSSTAGRKSSKKGGAAA